MGLIPLLDKPPVRRFNPKQLAGLELWLRADKGVLDAQGNPASDGEAVHTWQDQSGLGRHATQVGTPSIIRPDADISAGTWVVAPLFSKINEAVADDTGGSTILSVATAADTCEVSLGNITDPHTSEGHIVRYRYKRSNAIAVRNLEVHLMQGAVSIASWVHNGIPDTITAAAQTLSSAQADAITDYNDLRLRFIASGAAVTSSTDVTWAEVEVPNPKRPTLRQRTINGKLVWVLEFDGTDDFLNVPAIDLTGTQAVSLFVVAKASAAASWFLENGTDALAHTDAFLVVANYAIAGDPAGADLNGNVGIVEHQNAGTMTGAHKVLSAVFDKSKASAEALSFINGSGAGTQTVDSNNTNAFGNRASFIGSRAGTSLFLNGDIKEILLWSRALPASQHNRVGRYLTQQIAAAWTQVV